MASGDSSFSTQDQLPSIHARITRRPPKLAFDVTDCTGGFDREDFDEEETK